MANIIVCSGSLFPANVAGDSVDAAPACDTGWEIIPYVEPTDSTAIYAQLVALNDFDPERAGWIIVICLSTFVVGFGLGVVIKLLRRL